MSDFLSFLTWLLATAPTLLVYVVGIVLAAVFWRRYPRPALLTLIAMIVLLLLAVGGTFWSFWLPQKLLEDGVSTQQVGVILGASAFVRSVIVAIAMGLMLAAIFGWRRDRTRLMNGCHRPLEGYLPGSDSPANLAIQTRKFGE